MPGDEYINCPQHFLLFVIKGQTHMFKKISLGLSLQRIVSKGNFDELCTVAIFLNQSGK